jgi:light-regulated signal transduction histidine kinase (bacteriophytochrome)
MTPADRTPQRVPPHGGDQRRAAHQRRLDRKRSVLGLEDEIERLAARVAELEREKTQIEAFAAVAAHELVEPLVMTEAYAAIVSSRLDAAEHAESLRDLDALGRGVARMRLLTESLLHDARASHRQLELRMIDVNALVGDCVSLLRPEIAAREAQIVVADLPNVHADEGLLTGVFSNLLINALKYSPRLGARIDVGGVCGGGVCRYHVDSEGPAISLRDRERIFEIYKRGQGERRANGVGLGLTICRRIVERHGGEIAVESLNGRGNRFHFTLPV